MMHGQSDSDLTSLAPSSPRSPKRPVYYVVSPSRDSHDEDKSSSIHPTPTDSPSHPSYGRHSRASSGSRVSGPYGSSAASSVNNGRKGRSKRHDKGWRECNVIDEEADYDDLYTSKGFHRRIRVFIGIFGFVGIFTVFCLVIWGASRPFKPEIRVKSLTVHNLYFGQGSDLTGVPTKMITTNCSMKMNVYNPATFFGIHVSSVPVKLMFFEIVVASGELKKYYQSRKSHKTVTVKLEGIKVPLYGAGASLVMSDDKGVPLRLVFDLRSKGNVVGKLVKSKHLRHVSCSLYVHSRTVKPIRLKHGSCTYD
ncbi:Late embryogenesis abundant protein group 2 [Euphorbia peplus]|nr:Late embryogenesis abundant protein group 2 [Euphorbia peplus]